MSLFFRLFFLGETVENFPFFSKNNSPNFASWGGGRRVSPEVCLLVTVLMVLSVNVKSD